MLRNKLFFFVSYQGQRLKAKENPSTWYGNATTSVFTNQQLHDGNFAGDPGVIAFLSANPYFVSPGHAAADGVIDQAKFDPVAKKYIAAGYIPSTPSGLLNPTGNQVDNRNELSLKIDFQLDDKDKISATMGGTETQPRTTSGLQTCPDSRLYTGFSNTS